MTELGELGLSSYEETVYRSLLVTGAVTAAELSDASGVPRGRIYDVLNGLKARELVRAQSSDPTRYAPVEPDAVVDRLLAERAAELAREWNRYREVARRVRSELMPTTPADSSFWLGSLGSSEMRTAMEQHARTAEDFVHATVGRPYEHASWETLKTEVDAFFDGASPDVSIELLVSERVLDSLPERVLDSLAERSGDVALRTAPDVGLSFDVVDLKEATIDVLHPVCEDDRLGVVSVREQHAVETFEQQFRRLWADAEPVL